MLRKFKFYLFLHGLMIWEKNINKNNIKWFTRSCSWIFPSSVFTKKTCVLTGTCCVLFVFIFPTLIWCWSIQWNKYSMLFLFNIEITHPRLYNIQLRFTSLNNDYLRWIISDIKQKCMEYLLNINLLSK